MLHLPYILAYLLTMQLSYANELVKCHRKSHEFFQVRLTRKSDNDVFNKSRYQTIHKHNLLS